LHLALLVEHGPVADRWTEEQWTKGHRIHCASIASHGKNGSRDLDHSQLATVCHPKANT